jgi:opacity protein-like surface antigen
VSIQKSICSLALVLAAASSIGVGCAQAADSDEAAAVTAAQSWLGQVDKGAYGQSWKLGAGYLKANVRQSAFVQQLTGARKPLGKLISRKVLSKQSLTSIPGGPDGHYVVIQFDSVFAEKKAAVETVTPMLEKDGKWRVSGYFIK